MAPGGGAAGAGEHADGAHNACCLAAGLADHATGATPHVNAASNVRGRVS